MKQHPRNVRTGPSRVPTSVPGDADALTGTWEDGHSCTPPPVAVAAVSRAPTPANRRWNEVATEPPQKRSASSTFAAMLIGLALAATMIVLFAPPKQTAMALQTWVSTMPKWQPSAWIRPAVPVVDDALRQQRADASLRHDGYTSIPGGVLYTPESMSSSDGAFDLLLHFHGNVKVVVESVVAAKLNAAVAVVNLGVGSANYEDFYAAPGMYEDILEDIRKAVGRRGLEQPRIRRVALSSWSAGYGAISTILMRRQEKDPLDAILVLDGIHTSWQDGRRGTLLERRLAPFEQAAHAAASGSILFSITYSEIDPITYAGSRVTAEHLIKVAGQHGALIRDARPEAPIYRKLVAMRGAVAKRDAKRLEPFDDVRVGGFHAVGFRGSERGHHMAHLFQMGATVLPELAHRWSEYVGWAGRADAVRFGPEVWRDVERREHAAQP